MGNQPSHSQTGTQQSQSHSPQPASGSLLTPHSPTATGRSTRNRTSVSPEKGGGSGRIKTKKKSLELPDLNLNSLALTPATTNNISSNGPARIPSTAPSAPIPIPGQAGGGGGSAHATARPIAIAGNNVGVGRRASRDPPPIPSRNRIDSVDELGGGPSSLVVPPPPPLAPTSPVPAANNNNNNAPTNAPPFNRSLLSSTSSLGRKEKRFPRSTTSKKPYPIRVVKSNLPSGVPTNHDGIVTVLGATEYGPNAVPQLITVDLIFPGQANSVYVSGTHESVPWQTKTALQYDSDKRTWRTQLQVLPAAYHVKFLVDDTWKTSDALPLATDGSGHLVNYIDVRIRGPEIKEWGKDWWGVGTEDEEEQQQGAWSTTPPPYLELAAKQEEQDEQFRRSPGGQHNNHHPHSSLIRQQQQRIIPVNLPRPPMLPRHLDKVILNHRTTSSTTTGVGLVGGVGVQNGSSNGGGSGSPGRGRTPHPTSGNWPSPMTGLSPGGADLNDGDGAASSSAGRRKRSTRRDSAGAATAEAPTMLTSVNISPIGGDDNSVLPLPSHSVVNHLATSAIKNNVLAVGSTTRYKAKYITTIYYRPTHPEPEPLEDEGELDDGLAPGQHAITA